MNPQDHMMNNGKTYFNRGVRYYSWNPSNLDVSDPICMPVQQPAYAPYQAIDASPWGPAFSTHSGYSSVSPPGTASTSSSPHSEYGQSSDDLSVDSLITSLLQVVNGDDFNGRKDVRRTSPVINCRECTDVPCDSCLRAFTFFQPPPQQQQQQQQLQQHSPVHLQSRQLSPQIYMAPSEPTIQPMSLEIPPPILVHECNPSSSSPLYCEIHREAQRFYCQTCSRPFCAECGHHQHMNHMTVHLMEAIEKAGHQASQVLNEAQVSISIFKEDLDSVQITAEVLEQKSREAAAEVMMVVRRAMQALEFREKELLEKIETSRQAKFDSLKARDDGLRKGISRLSKACERLQDAIDAATLASNPFDLLVTKDMASAEVFQMRTVRKHWQPVEENWISFTGPEANAMNAIANLGNIITNNPGPIGDRRTVRGRGNGGASPQFFRGGSSPNPSNVIQNFPLSPVPRGRAVPSSGYPVVVQSGLAGQPSPRNPVIQLGNNGEIHDNLCRPWGVTCDRDGNVIIADRSNNRIQIFRTDGTFVRRFGTHGTGPAQFDRPAGIAVDSRRRIIVADKDNHRVQVLTMEGHFLLSFGEKGCGLGQFNYPWDVAVNSECQIVVSDTRNHRVQLFSPEGIFLRKYGFETTNTMWKNFDSPRGVAFNPEGNIAVTDFNNHRVVIVDADFMNSRVLACDMGTNNRQVQRPQGLIVDDEGNIIVADSRNHRVLIFDSTGKLKGHVGTAGAGPEQMDRPSGVALTPEGRILAVDFGNNRVLLI